MAGNLSKGAVQVLDLSVLGVNQAIMEVQRRIDQLSGLNGRTVIYDLVAVEDPVASGDAVNLETAALSSYVTVGTTQTITGQKTFKGVAMRFTDADGNLVHAFGTTP